MLSSGGPLRRVVFGCAHDVESAFSVRRGERAGMADRIVWWGMEGDSKMRPNLEGAWAVLAVASSPTVLISTPLSCTFRHANSMFYPYNHSSITNFFDPNTPLKSK